MFKKGDMAVYPAHGVGEILGFEKKNIGGVEQEFYIMKIVDTSMIVMIPCVSSEKVGLRKIINNANAELALDVLTEEGQVLESQPWNQRYREYTEKIKTGDVNEIAGVVRDLYVLQKDKELSFGERKMMDTAKGLLVKEIALSYNRDEDSVTAQIEAIFDE